MRIFRLLEFKKVFQLDLFGAVLSSISLAVILPFWQPFFGIPLSVLKLLACCAVLLSVFDLTCIFFLKKETHIEYAVRGLIGLNTMYLFLSIIEIIMHRNLITFWGHSYLIVEVFILIVLIYFECKMLKHFRTLSLSK